MNPDSFRLPLSFYRTHTRYPQLSDADWPLPEQLDEVIAALGGGQNDDRFGKLARSLEVSPEEILEASRFFVCQVLSAPNGDHYRVLGVDPDADGDEIRQRYRTLIRIFHPDRRVEDAREEAFAGRINEAWTTLKDPKKRRAYDRKLGAKRFRTHSAHLRERSPDEPVRGIRSAEERRRFSPSAGEVLYRSRLWSRRPSAVIWGGIIVIAVGAVLAAVLSSKHLRPQLDTGDGPATTPGQAAVAAPDATNGLSDDRAAVEPVNEDRTQLALTEAGDHLTGPESGTETAARPHGIRVTAPLPSVTVPDLPEPDSPVSQPVPATAGESNPAPETETPETRAVPEPPPPSPAATAAAAGGVPFASPGAEARTSTRTDRTPAERTVPAPAEAPVPAPAVVAAAAGKPSAARAPEPAPAAPSPAGEGKTSTLTPPPDDTASTRAETEVPSRPGVAAASAAGSRKPVYRSLPSSAGNPAAPAQKPASVEKEPTQTVVATAAAATGYGDISKLELNMLLARFVAAYENGDLKRFTRVFSRDVSLNEGEGYRAVRKEYGKLFRKTDARRMALNDIRWVVLDDTRLKGWASTDIELWPEGGSGSERFEGDIVMVVEKKGKDLKITRLDHRMGSRR